MTRLCPLKLCAAALKLCAAALLLHCSLATTDPVQRQQQPLSADDDMDDTPLPVIIWHGLGDTFNGDGIKRTAELIEEVNPGTLVYVVRVAGSAEEDRRATYLGDVSAQLEAVCADIAAHPILSTAPAVDALGFSQGGQFLRGYIERCNFPPVRSLVTYGSQHTGITDYRACGDRDFLCRGAMRLLKANTYGEWTQTHVVPAQYYRDRGQYEQYLESSNFLADINNEREVKNKTYAENMKKLQNFAMYMWDADTVVIPKETAWFWDETTNLTRTRLYEEDWIGLKQLDSEGKLYMRSLEGNHMELTDVTLAGDFAEFFGPLKQKTRTRTEGDERGQEL